METYAERPALQLQKGLSTLCCSQQPFDEALINLLHQKDVSIIELSDHHPEFSYDVENIENIAESLQKKGIKTSTIHSHIETYIPGVTISAVSKDDRVRALKNYKAVIDSVSILQGDFLVTHDIHISADDKEKRKALIENVRELADYAADKNIRIAIENGGATHITGKSILHRSLLEDIARENVGACFDTGHANLVEDVAGFLRIIDKYLFTLHIHDNKGETDNHQIPGWGIIDWPGVVNALKTIDYHGVFMYEVNTPEILDEWKSNLKDWVHHH